MHIERGIGLKIGASLGDRPFAYSSKNSSVLTCKWKVANLHIYTLSMP